MGFIEVILTVCAIANPVNCEDKRLQFAWDGSPRQCAMMQMPIAAWIGDHPEWIVRRWSCDVPDKRKQDT